MLRDFVPDRGISLTCGEEFAFGARGVHRTPSFNLLTVAAPDRISTYAAQAGLRRRLRLDSVGMARLGPACAATPYALPSAADEGAELRELELLVERPGLRPYQTLVMGTTNLAAFNLAIITCAAVPAATVHRPRASTDRCGCSATHLENRS
jgi:hypothetical protein